MILGRKKIADKDNDQRQRLISYKKFFDSPDGRVILLDLMNRFSLGINANTGKTNEEMGRLNGRNDVMVHIFSNVYTPLEHFEKLLKGDFT